MLSGFKFIENREARGSVLLFPFHNYLKRIVKQKVKVVITSLPEPSYTRFKAKFLTASFWLLDDLEVLF